MDVPTDRLGAPGIPQELHLVRGAAPGVQATPEQDKAALSDSSERDFTVVVHLGKEPGSFSSTSLDVSLEPAHGASLIVAPPGIELGFDTTVGKIETVVGIALIGLHVFTLRDRRRDDEEDDAPAPLPPGPTSSPDEPG